MRILIVHDRAEVSECIRERCLSIGIEDHSIDIAPDYVTAHDSLRARVYDIAVVDLTIPHIQDSTEASYQSADNLIQEILASSGLNPPGDLIAITRDPEALKLIETRIEGAVFAVIEEDNEALWLETLTNKIEYIRRFSRSRYFAATKEYDYDLLLITALDEEMKPHRDRYDMFSSAEFEGVSEFLFGDKTGAMRRGIAFSIGRAGQHSAASYTQSLITWYRPKLCVMTGICGAVRGKLKLGEVAIFETVIDWDSGKWKSERTGWFQRKAVFRPRPDPLGIRDTPVHRISRSIVENNLAARAEIEMKMREIGPEPSAALRIKLGPAASGSAVIAEASVIQRIRGLNENVQAVDMESYGFYHAALTTHVIRPAFVCIKGACDFCEPDKDDRYHEVAAYVSAEVAHEFIALHWTF